MPPPTPTTAPDLTSATDTGAANSDNITADTTPAFEISCSSIGNTVTLYSDKPAIGTAVGSKVCTGVGVDTVTVTTTLNEGLQQISYTEQNSAGESAQSPALGVRIDSLAPQGPGSLSGPGSPGNDSNADLIGSCGTDAANGSVWVSTTPDIGFDQMYNTTIPLDASGNFVIADPNWKEGSYNLHFGCVDLAGNGPAALGPFGPVVIYFCPILSQTHPRKPPPSQDPFQRLH